MEDGYLLKHLAHSVCSGLGLIQVPYNVHRWQNRSANQWNGWIHLYHFPAEKRRTVAISKCEVTRTSVSGAEACGKRRRLPKHHAILSGMDFGFTLQQV